MLLPVQEMWAWSWVGKVPWRGKQQPTPSTLAWEIPWTEAWRAIVHRITNSLTWLSMKACTLMYLLAKWNKSEMDFQFYEKKQLFPHFMPFLLIFLFHRNALFSKSRGNLFVYTFYIFICLLIFPFLLTAFHLMVWRFSLLLFSLEVWMTLQPHWPQHIRLPCPSLSLGVCSNSDVSIIASLYWH